MNKRNIQETEKGNKNQDHKKCGSKLLALHPSSTLKLYWVTDATKHFGGI
jgi:hypothetical protein